jgi:hypothetical protein
MPLVMDSTFKHDIESCITSSPLNRHGMNFKFLTDNKGFFCAGLDFVSLPDKIWHAMETHW